LCALASGSRTQWPSPHALKDSLYECDTFEETGWSYPKAPVPGSSHGGLLSQRWWKSGQASLAFGPTRGASSFGWRPLGAATQSSVSPKRNQVSPWNGLLTDLEQEKRECWFRISHFQFRSSDLRSRS
jgi:hypothetical protein